MMKILNGIIYLALMFYLGTGAVVNTEPKINEDTPADVRALFEEMIEKPMVDQMVEHNVADIDPQNEQLITDDSKTADLQNVDGMHCRWHGRIGICCVYTFHMPRVCVIMRFFAARMTIVLTLNGHHLITRTYRTAVDKTFIIHFRHGYIAMNVALKYITHNNFQMCFNIAYHFILFHGTQHLGCISRRFPYNENSGANRIEDLDSHVKDSLELPDFDTGKIYSVGILGEENQNKDSLIWQRDE